MHDGFYGEFLKICYESSYIFLTLLVIVTTIMSSIIQRWLPDDDFEITPSSSTNFGVDERVAAVIQAVLEKHRCRHK